MQEVARDPHRSFATVRPGCACQGAVVARGKDWDLSCFRVSRRQGTMEVKYPP